MSKRAEKLPTLHGRLRIAGTTAEAALRSLGKRALTAKILHQRLVADHHEVTLPAVFRALEILMGYGWVARSVPSSIAEAEDPLKAVRNRAAGRRVGRGGELTFTLTDLGRAFYG